MPPYRALLYCALMATTLLLDSNMSAPAGTTAYLVPTKVLPTAALALHAADARSMTFSAVQRPGRGAPTAVAMLPSQTIDATRLSCPTDGRSLCRSGAEPLSCGSVRVATAAAVALVLGAVLGRTASSNARPTEGLKPQEQPEESAVCPVDDALASNDSSACEEATQLWLRSEDKRLERRLGVRK